jgi:uncharacterized protein (DUF2164 family)
MRRKWDVSPKETRRQCAEDVLARIKQQDDAEFGIIAAEEIIDIVAQHIGADIYNLAIKDARKLVQDRLADLDIEMDILKHES